MNAKMDCQDSHSFLADEFSADKKQFLKSALLISCIQIMLKFFTLKRLNNEIKYDERFLSVVDEVERGSSFLHQLSVQLFLKLTFIFRKQTLRLKFCSLGLCRLTII